MAVRVMLVDDHAIFRGGLKALLSETPEFEVVAEAGDGFSALRLLAETRVDVVVLDLTLPGLPGIRVAEDLAKTHPRLPVVVLTMHEDVYYLRELLKVGARGFVLKKSTGRDLVKALRTVLRGQLYVDPSFGQFDLEEAKTLQSLRGPGGLDSLTPREQEVCRLLALGYTNAEIADRLAISPRTVETHRNHITAKLGVRSRAELVRFALDHGLLKG
ncbi:MAG: response regulator transcription factor [Acidobacteriota bacterium]